jgi:hypothetical protein|eukprot:COSAG06_NODE_2880_length_6138_cov_2.667826_3_plen_67_part_00
MTLRDSDRHDYASSFLGASQVWLLAVGHALPDRGWGGSSFKDMRPTIATKLGISNDRIRTQASKLN